MCGIAGAVDPRGSIGIEAVEALNRAQHLRGPDDRVVVERAPFLLGNTRLAIQDPGPAANQPFEDPEGHITVVFNGEIYNFRELAHDHGLKLRTGCDGEIIPLLWSRFGRDCLRLFRGMFAIAVVDRARQRLYLARDPFGIKPLHWRRHGDGVLFASDVMPLWRADRRLPLAGAALEDYLGFGAVGAARTPFDGIEAVPPGGCVSFGADAKVRSEGVDPAFGPGAAWEFQPGGSDRPLASAFRASVRLHLRADVPTALLLSAGVDSTLLALAAREEGHSLHCLTVRSPWGVDESPQAEATAVEYGHSHECVAAELGDGVVERFFGAMSRPTIDGLNSFLVNRAVNAAGYKVALSGLGGDEALGGYHYARFVRALPLLRVLDAIPGAPVGPVLRRVERGTHSGSGKLERLVAPGGPRSPAGLVALQRELFTPDRVRSLLGRPVQPGEEAGDAGGVVFDLAQAEVEHYLGPMLLPDADAFSMASSVELRVPFVDGPFFAAALRRRRVVGKVELVRQMGDQYLDRLSRRRKTGFSVPMHEWMRTGPLRDVVADAARSDAPVWELLDPAVGRPVLDQVAERPRWSEAWAIAALDGWLRTR